MIGLTVYSTDGATMCASGLQAGLVDDELAELLERGSVRRVFGHTVLHARHVDGLIILMLWERKTRCLTTPLSEWRPTPLPE